MNKKVCKVSLIGIVQTRIFFFFKLSKKNLHPAYIWQKVNVYHGFAHILFIYM
jgi:hypothetical protein